LYNIINDEEVRRYVDSWPTVKNNKGETLADAYKNETINEFLETGVPKSEIDKLRSMNFKTIACRVSEIVFSAAKAERPDIFSDLPEINPRIFEAGKSGSYWYSEDGKTAGYTFNEDSLYSFGCPGKLFADFLHETEHIIQWHLAQKEPNLAADDPLKKAAQVFADEFRRMDGKNQDQSISLYPAGPKSDPAHRAYEARPTEYYAYKHDRSFLKKFSKAISRSPERPTPATTPLPSTRRAGCLPK
jgi:hypothetical protein